MLGCVVGPSVLVALTHHPCRHVRATDVPTPADVAATSPAGKACARAVIRDWYPDGVVDRAYPLRCYGFALAALPVDTLDYSTVRKDITRAYTRRALELHGGQRLC